MKFEDWSTSKDAVEMLRYLKAESEVRYLKNTKILQLYYIKCCRERLFLLKSKEFKRGLDIAEDYVFNRATLKQVYDQNWATEGAVFGIEYNTYPNENLESLFKIRLYQNLDHEAAHRYAINLGYFIDWVMLYATDFNGEIPEGYQEFLSADILRTSINRAKLYKFKNLRSLRSLGRAENARPF